MTTHEAILLALVACAMTAEARVKALDGHSPAPISWSVDEWPIQLPCSGIELDVGCVLAAAG
jgi:hypothetical protein